MSEAKTLPRNDRDRETVPYDFRTAVTFTLIGAGIGALMALVSSPRSPRLVVSEKRIPKRPASEPTRAAG